MTHDEFFNLLLFCDTFLLIYLIRGWIYERMLEKKNDKLEKYVSSLEIKVMGLECKLKQQQDTPPVPPPSKTVSGHLPTFM